MRCFVVFTLGIVCVTAGNAGKNSRSAGSSNSAGIGAYAYQDSTGNRYGGTYDIDPEDIQNLVYAPGYAGFQDFRGGFPFGGQNEFFEFFKHLQAPFQNFNNFQANPAMNFHNPGNFYAQPGAQYGHDYSAFVPDSSNFQGGNAAFAGGYIGPDGTRQVAGISPSNPKKPNIDVRSGAGSNGNNGGYYSVSSSAYASSSDVGGKKSQSRGAKTVINRNGQITEYEVNE